jgi:RNA polymerase sigma factor (sigma-70 family)
VTRQKKNAQRERELRQAVEAHRPRLLSVIGRRIQNEADAEDVFQDVVEEYVEAYDLGYAIESLSSWLVRVAQNKILDRFRRKRTVSENARETEQAFDPAPSRGPEGEWTDKWIREEIAEALAALPEEQREVFVLNELEGLSFEKISEMTGVGVNTLLSRKRYAIKFLREYLQETYDELE